MPSLTLSGSLRMWRNNINNYLFTIPPLRKTFKINRVYIHTMPSGEFWLHFHYCLFGSRRKRLDIIDNNYALSINQAGSSHRSPTWLALNRKYTTIQTKYTTMQIKYNNSNYLAVARFLYRGFSLHDFASLLSISCYTSISSSPSTLSFLHFYHHHLLPLLLSSISSFLPLHLHSHHPSPSHRHLHRLRIY